MSCDCGVWDTLLPLCCHCWPLPTEQCQQSSVNRAVPTNNCQQSSKISGHGLHVLQRGDFVVRRPASASKEDHSSRAEQGFGGAGQFSSRTGQSDCAGQISSRTGRSDGAGQLSSRSGPSSSAGQGSVQQPFSHGTSRSSHQSELSSSGIGRFSSRPGQSSPALHLRESISGLLNPREEEETQVSHTAL